MSGSRVHSFTFLAIYSVFSVCLPVCLFMSVLPLSVILVYKHLSHSSLPLLSLFLSLSVHLLFYFPLSPLFLVISRSLGLIKGFY